MAGNNGADGSITIDTRLDTSGFKRESAKMNTAVSSLSRQINNLGKSLQATFSKGANPAAIERLNGKIAEAQQQLQAMQERLLAFGQTEIRTEEYARVCAEIEKTDKALQRLYERQEKLKAMGADQTSAQWQALQKDIEETTSKLDFYKQGLKEAQDFLKEMQSPEAAAEAHAGGPEAWADYKAGIENAKEEIEANRAEVDKLDAALTKLLEKQEQMKARGADQGSRQWQSLQYDIERTRELQDQLNASREQMENNGTDVVLGSSTEAYRRMSEEIEALGQRMASMGEKSGITKALFAGLASIIGKVGLSAAKAGMQLSVMIGKGVITGLKQVYSAALKATKALLTLHSSSKQASSGFKMGFRTILKYGLGIRSTYMLFRKLRSAIVESMGTMAKVDKPTNAAISSMKSALDQLKNALGSAFQPIVTAVAPYVTQFLTMLSSVATKIAEFFAMLTGQKYILKATAQQTDYAKSLDKTKKSAKEAKAQLAGFDQLNILTDSSSGKDDEDDAAGKYEKVPVSGISDFLKRLKDAFLKGDFEEIGKIIAEKINGIFQKIKDLISWDNVGPVITKWVNNFCDLINSLVDNINWELIGQTFAAGINTLLHTLSLLLLGIDWEAIGAALATGLSAMINDIDWELLGQTLALLFTLKLRMLAAAIEAFDWVGLGEALARGLNSFIKTMTDIIEGIDWAGLTANFIAGLNSLVENVDWAALGNLIGVWMSTVLTVLGTAITTFDWVALGDGLATGINSAIEKLHEAILAFPWAEAAADVVNGINQLFAQINWEELGNAFGDAVNGVLAFTFTAITTFDWAALGTDLATFVDNAIKTVDWSQVSATVSGAITGILTTAKEFIVGLNPWTIANAIREFAAGIDWPGLASSIFSFLSSALGTALATLGATIGGLIKDAFVGIEEYFEAQVEEAGGNVVLGILSGIGNAVVGIAEWINENIFQPFINGFKSLFKIESPSKVMEELGGFIVEGLKNGISGVWEAIKQFFVDAWENIKGIFTDANIGEWFTTNVWEKITGAFTGAGEWFKTAAGEMWNGITSFFTELGEGITSWFTENVWNKITGAFSGVKDWFSNMAGNIWDGLTGGLSDGVEAAKEKVSGFFSNVWNGVLDFFGIHSPSTLAKDAAGNVLDGFTEGAEEKQESAGTKLKNVFSGIYDAAKGVWDKVTGWLGKLFGWGDNEDTEAQNAEREASQAAGKVATGIETSFTNIETSISGPIEDGVSAGKVAFADLEKTAKTTVTNIVNAFTASNTGLKDVLIKALDDSDKSVGKSMTSIKDNVDGVLSEIKKNTTDTLTTLTSTITSKMTSLKTNISTTLTTVKTKFTTELRTIQTQSETTFKNISSTVQSETGAMEQSVSSGFSSIHSSIRDNLNNALSTARSMNWRSIGDNIINGISAGINSGWGWLQNTVWNLAQSLYNSAKAALGIHSPSRLFRDGVGKMLGLGVAEGMEATQPTILDSVTNITDSIADEMRDADAIANLRVNGDSLLNGIDSVLSSFSDKVTDTFSDMVARISAITESVAFRVPVVASGGAIPYNVSAKAGDSSEGLADALVASNEDLGDIIIQSVTNATEAIVQAIERYCGSREGVDKRALADEVIREINRRTRMNNQSPLLV